MSPLLGGLRQVFLPVAVRASFDVPRIFCAPGWGGMEVVGSCLKVLPSGHTHLAGGMCKLCTRVLGAKDAGSVSILACMRQQIVSQVNGVLGGIDADLRHMIGLFATFGQ